MCPSSCQDKLIAELFRIICLGDVDDCLKFVKKNLPSAENWCRLRHGKSGDTVPIIAAACGHVSVLALCRDVDLESSNKDGKRPLHAAAQSSHVDCVRYLLSRGVMVDCLKRADWYVSLFIGSACTSVTRSTVAVTSCWEILTTTNPTTKTIPILALFSNVHTTTKAHLCLTSKFDQIQLKRLI